jgi:hypothetical protein
MTTQRDFPRTLLSESIEARFRYFQNKVIAHPRLIETHDALLHTIRHPAGASLIFVYGPTGVGKTTLRFRIEKQLTEESLPDLEQDPGRIPVVGLEVVSPESGSFSWKDYHIRALIALDDPVFAHKIDYDTRASTRSRNGQYVIARMTSIAELRRVLEGCLRYRRPVAFINDEAQHFKKTASGRRLLDQMDTLKSLAEVTDTVYVLIGTYEVLDLTNLSAQLSRRSVEIHFPRYRWDDPKDMSVFRNVLLTFQHHLPFNEEPDLLGNCDYLYEGCLGCVGILKTWLNRTCLAGLEEGAETLNRAHLEQHAEPTRRLLRMAREIKEGEDMLQATKEQRTDLRVLLGMESSPSQADEPEQQQTHDVPRRRSHLEQRTPVRDRVGAGENGC